MEDERKKDMLSLMSLSVSQSDLVQLTKLDSLDAFLELGDLPSLRRIIESIPGWSNQWLAKVRATSGGMTNVVILVEFQSGGGGSSLVGGFGSAYIVRIRSAFSTQDTSVLVDLNHERKVALLASQLGIGPKCVLEFANGRVEDYIQGQQVSSGRMREPDVATGVAEALAEFHVRMYEVLFTYAGGEAIENPPLEEGRRMMGVSFWERVTGWLTFIQEAGDEGMKGALDGVKDEILRLEDIVDGWDAHIGYCHNDLQCGNMLLVTLQDKTTVRLIDYEYATVGDICFDIANHFCEYAADYESDTSAAILDWTKLPSRKQAIFFCRAYAAHLFKYENHTGTITSDGQGSLCKAIEKSCRDFDQSGEDQKSVGFDQSDELACNHKANMLHDYLDAAAIILYEKSHAFEALSHLQWALWGFIQHCISTIDFDFLRYGYDRLNRYHETKQRILAQRHP